MLRNQLSNVLLRFVMFRVHVPGLCCLKFELVTFLLATDETSDETQIEVKCAIRFSDDISLNTPLGRDEGDNL